MTTLLENHQRAEPLMSDEAIATICIVLARSQRHVIDVASDALNTASSLSNRWKRSSWLTPEAAAPLSKADTSAIAQAIRSGRHLYELAHALRIDHATVAFNQERLATAKRHASECLSLGPRGRVIAATIELLLAMIAKAPLVDSLSTCVLAQHACYRVRDDDTLLESLEHALIDQVEWRGILAGWFARPSRPVDSTGATSSRSSSARR
jgi:hypothetical protein